MTDYPTSQVPCPYTQISIAAPLENKSWYHLASIGSLLALNIFISSSHHPSFHPISSSPPSHNQFSLLSFYPTLIKSNYPISIPPLFSPTPTSSTPHPTSESPSPTPDSAPYSPYSVSSSPPHAPSTPSPSPSAPSP
jgi:hypothetical protein